jgi:hypothetical protein
LPKDGAYGIAPEEMKKSFVDLAKNSDRMESLVEQFLGVSYVE